MTLNFYKEFVFSQKDSALFERKGKMFANSATFSIRKMAFFNSHLTSEQLANLIDHNASLTTDSKAHLTACAYCAKEFSALSKSISLMKSDASFDAPPAAHSFAVNLFRTRRQFQLRRPSVKETLLAVLKIDFSHGASVLGERSAAVNVERQMLFTAGTFDVDLRIRKSGAGFTVRGQVLGDVAAESQVRLENEQMAFATVIADTGEFSLTEVPDGIFNLRFVLGETEIIAELRLE